MVTLIILEDQPIVRTSIRLLLEAEPNFTVLAEYANDSYGMSQVQHLRPDVVVVDLALPGLYGFEVVRRLTSSLEAPHIVMMSVLNDMKYILQAFAGGASAYVLKTAQREDLIQAIKAAMDGAQFVSLPF